MNPNDFLTGKYDDRFQMVNTYSDAYNKFTPLYKGRISRELGIKLFSTIPELKYALSKWQANVGANGSRVVIETGDGVSARTEREKNNLQKRIYKVIYKDYQWKQVESQIVELIAREGNAVLMFNNEGKVIVESIHRFNVYWDNVNKIARYAYLVDGTEQVGMQNLSHGIELYHLKDPASQSLPIAPSRLEGVIDSIIMRQHGVTANAKIFEGGFISNVLLMVDKDSNDAKQLTSLEKDSNQKTYMDRTIERIRDFFGGSNKAGRAGIFPWLRDAKELGKDNKSMQFSDILRLYVPEQIAWNFGMVLPDFGTGPNMTYNNANTFDAALFDKVGRPLQRIFDGGREWVLNTIGIKTSERLYMEYNEPEDPNELLEAANKLEELKANAITLNEWRDWRGLEPIEGGDVMLSERLTPPPVATVDPAQQGSTDATFAKKKVSITEKTLQTEQYDKFLGRWQKALTAQTDAWLAKFERRDSVDDQYAVHLTKIESHYDFKTLKKDLTGFAQLGADDFYKDARVKKQYADDPFGVIPQAVLDYLDTRTEALLKGNDEFDSVDVQTASEIETLIKNNLSKPLSEIVALLKENFAVMTENRAKLIAETETANALEGTRHMMYVDEFTGGEKEWQSVHDDRVRDSHRNNESEGQIPIEKAFTSGEQRAGQAPRCRCTVYYYPPENYLTR